jgi:hypothetical protein
MVPSKKISQAIRIFNPKYLVQALFLNLRKGVTYIILPTLMILLLCLPILLVFKLIYPQNVGCFMGENSFSFGFISVTSNTTEILGNWFFPTTLLLIIFFYFSVIFLLKSLKRTTLV